MTLYEKVVNEILRQLRQGDIDSDQFIKWLQDTGLTEDEAWKCLDELIKKVEDE